MNRRTWLIVIACLLSSACHRDPGFTSPEQEYRYLRGLSNPTPEQYLRKEELATKPARERHGSVHSVRDAIEEEDRNHEAAESLPR